MPTEAVCQPQDEVSRVHTREEVRAWMASKGVTVRQWAADNGFKEGDVTKVLRGHLSGRFGAAHNIAVALGLKVGQRTDLADGNQS